MPSSSVHVISKSTVFPNQKSSIKPLKLSVSDLPMLSCQYIQKGVLLSQSPIESRALISLLKSSLSQTLTHFPALAGRLSTDPSGHVYILCNDAGVDFIHAKAECFSVNEIIAPLVDLHHCFKEFFAFDSTLSYAGHYKPIAAVQVTELADGLFIGCTVNHAVVDGTSFWNFFNTFAEVTKGVKQILNSPNFCRENVFNSPVPLPLPAGGPAATFAGDEPLRETIFHFSREAILKMKFRANNPIKKLEFDSDLTGAEIFGKQSNENWKHLNGTNGRANGNITSILETLLQNGGAEIFGKQSNENWKHLNGTNGRANGNITSVLETLLQNGGAAKPADDQISSFQSLSAQLWRAVTRARKLDSTKTTTFRMAVNCRHRLDPKVDPLYFGNLIQSIPTVASIGDLLSNDLNWSADLLHKNVVSHGNATVRRGVADWEKNPRVFPLGNFDGAMITMGSSPRFPMYNNDFGWGRPLAIRSGKANKFDGKISAFPGRDGDGSVDLEVVLAPETMAGIESDAEFMQYVS